MRHWLSMMDYDPAELAGLVALARRIKRDAAVGATMSAGHPTAALRGKILGMVFFNPSLRTRASFEAAMLRFGGHAICLNVGGDTWNLEHRDGVVMNGDKAEHVREAAPVLSRYCDALAVRTFAGLKDAAEDAADALIRAFARHATVPLINMESAMEHPCQGLADWMTIDERFGSTRGRRLTLTWAPQAKAVPMAVPHSAALAAAAAGMEVTIAHPPGYELNQAILDKARSWCAAAGANLSVTHDQASACAAADVVYVKSWGSTAFYGKPAEQTESFRRHADWMVDVRHLRRPQAILMHCLPVRRNVVISDAGLDDPRCVVVDQAENRLWTQAAVLSRLLSES
ncbi:MAG: N-acetylornithine carbamoyltransferase [Phycisphaerae bacterium]|nr:N-acetylornithine carbamoyltransferase [Phycisphaerae bacterium]NUQ47411.1 N-acetylornithine carbamoyltransferase [Phycisphaerae bacterium]